MGDKLPDYYNSIFQQLFEHVADRERRLLLLDEILEVGDQKEIPFLDWVIKDQEDPVLKEKALVIKSALFEKMHSTPDPDKKLHPSLCFLYDAFDIRPPEDKIDPDIDFEISIEILAPDYTKSE